MIHITLDLEPTKSQSWHDMLGEKDKIVVLEQPMPPMRVAVVERGMTSGRPSVMIRFDLPDGRYLVAETSARLFVQAAKMIHHKYPDLFRDTADPARQHDLKKVTKELRGPASQFGESMMLRYEAAELIEQLSQELDDTRRSWISESAEVARLTAELRQLKGPQSTT